MTVTFSARAMTRPGAAPVPHDTDWCCFFETLEARSPGAGSPKKRTARKGLFSQDRVTPDDQSAWRRKNAGISKSSMPPDARASTLAAAWVRLVRHTLGTLMLP